MIIVVECKSTRDADEMVKELSKKFENKIKKVYRYSREVMFNNGDIMKFISVMSYSADGLKADVAIGPRSNYFTCASKQPKRMWELVDMKEYFRNL